MDWKWGGHWLFGMVLMLCSRTSLQGQIRRCFWRRIFVSLWTGLLKEGHKANISVRDEFRFVASHH